MYYVYLLRCADGTLYTGITTDPARRLAEHRSGHGAKYTAAHAAVRFEGLFSAPDRAAASRLEYRIKQLAREDKERLLRGEAPLDLAGYDRVPLAGEGGLPGPENARYRLIRSARRTLSAEITAAGEVLVRAPFACGDAEIARFLGAHARWIAVHREKQRTRAAAHPEPDDAARAALIARAKEVLPARVAFYGARMGLRPAAVTITGARKRFGSCSGRDRICFSWRLMQYPPEAVDYVVVHELAHIVHKNHGKPFYALIASILPDWRARQALLRS